MSYQLPENPCLTFITAVPNMEREKFIQDYKEAGVLSVKAEGLRLEAIDHNSTRAELIVTHDVYIGIARRAISRMRWWNWQEKDCTDEAECDYTIYSSFLFHENEDVSSKGRRRREWEEIYQIMLAWFNSPLSQGTEPRYFVLIDLPGSDFPETINIYSPNPDDEQLGVLCTSDSTLSTLKRLI